VIRVEDVTRTYKIGSHEVYALRGVNLALPAGTFAVLRGRSGSGKTTLLNIVGGLDRPDSGQVYLYDQPLGKLTEVELTRLRRQRIGFVFQSFALLPTFTAYENVELALRIGGAPLREHSQRATRCLEIVGLKRWSRHRPYEMSGGQQQRVAIARALVTRPDMILADEPTGELDSMTGRRIYRLFQEIVVHENITLLLATHDPVAAEYASIVFDLRDGQIVEEHNEQARNANRGL
jgi:ABC-type lipoprotein export system ATPase subunit